MFHSDRTSASIAKRSLHQTLGQSLADQRKDGIRPHPTISIVLSLCFDLAFPVLLQALGSTMVMYHLLALGRLNNTQHHHPDSLWL
jgi:hypothetical protein